MNISIIGSGNIGGTLARLLVRAGKSVTIGNRRGPDSLRSLQAEVGASLHAATAEDAVVNGELVILAVPWRAKNDLPPPSAFRSKIVIDAMNPYTPNGAIEDLKGVPSSDIIVRQLRPASLVKAFNTIHFRHLANNGDQKSPLEERQVIPVSGDSLESKALVASLITEIGFSPLDIGGLAISVKLQEPGRPIYNKVLKLSEAEQVLKNSGDT